MKRYSCQSCTGSFSVDHRRKEAVLWVPHINGIPFRKLGDERGMSGKQAYTRVFVELGTLPDNTVLTQKYCTYTSGILIIDGKYVKVRGYKQKIPFIYAIDYETHDILFGILAASEDTEAFLECFRILKQLNYPLRVVVADDRSSLPIALKQIYPDIPLQLCQNHYIENIRKLLHIRSETTHQHFFNSLKKHVFDEYSNDEKLNTALHHVLTQRCENMEIRQTIVMEIDRRRTELFTYPTIPNCPKDTNLIELFNSHFNARIKSLKGFKTLLHATLWLNGLLIRRRTKPFTDCSPKFKHLNGKCSLQMSIKKQAHWPEILGLKAPKR
ncbi:MAG: transposase [Candidatus Kerfeldbacteria bacterium]|nr:transposase [Candidatus Kerfeldbacteria bacterium]